MSCNFNRIENARSRRLDILKVLQKNFGISAIEAHIVLRGRAGIETNGRANHESYGLGFRLADALVRISPAVSKVHV